jgi:hypothetical protein
VKLVAGTKVPVERTAIMSDRQRPGLPHLDTDRMLAKVEASTPVLLYDAACRAVAECVRVDDVKVWRDKAMAVQVYAKQAKNTQMIEDATEIRVRAERRAGELLAVMEKAKGGQPYQKSTGRDELPVAPTLKEIGVTKDQSSKWQKLASLNEAEFEKKVTAAKRRAAKSLDGIQQLGGSGDGEYFTPPKYVEAVRDVLGEIDLDPASCIEAQVTVKAKHYYTKADDGLKQEWWGRVFLNPPYKRRLIGTFVQKLIEEYRLGRVNEAVLLAFNNTSAAWFQEAPRVASAICFTRGNPAFLHKTQGQMGRASIGAAFLYFGSDVEKFVRRFAEFGFVVEPIRR